MTVRRAGSNLSGPFQGRSRTTAQSGARWRSEASPVPVSNRVRRFWPRPHGSKSAAVAGRFGSRTGSGPLLPGDVEGGLT
jgi:hypothetical protein